MEPQINFHGHAQKRVTKIIVIDPYFSSLNAGDKKTLITQNLIKRNSLRSRDVTSSSSTAHGFDQNLWYHFFKPSNVDD